MPILDLVLLDQSDRRSAEDLLIFTELTGPLIFLWNWVVIIPPFLLFAALTGSDNIFVDWFATCLLGRGSLRCSLLLRIWPTLLICKALSGMRARGCIEA